MMSIIYVFWMYVFLFAIIGWMRGWAKELLVSFSVILSLALNHVIRRYIPLAANLADTDVSLFWVRTIILLVLVYFGYQTVISIPHLAAKGRTEKLQDTLFGAFLVTHCRECPGIEMAHSMPANQIPAVDQCTKTLRGLLLGLSCQFEDSGRNQVRCKYEKYNRRQAK